MYLIFCDLSAVNTLFLEGLVESFLLATITVTPYQVITGPGTGQRHSKYFSRPFVF